MASEFVEVTDQRTHLVQRVPREWLENPVLGRFIEKTPAQRALDGELGQAPTEDSTVLEIRGFAKDAGIDVTGLSKKDELLEAVRGVVGNDPLPVGVDADDVDVQDPGVGEPITTTTDPDPNPGPDETPATGDDEEN